VPCCASGRGSSWAPSPSYGKACEWYFGFVGWQAPRSCAELSPPNLFIVCSKGNLSLGDARVPVLRTYCKGIDVPSCLASVPRSSWASDGRESLARAPLIRRVVVRMSWFTGRCSWSRMRKMMLAWDARLLSPRTGTRCPSRTTTARGTAPFPPGMRRSIRVSVRPQGMLPG